MYEIQDCASQIWIIDLEIERFIIQFKFIFNAVFHMLDNSILMF